jgi:hypothetical protein
MIHKKVSLLTVAPPMARATLAPIPTMHLVRICVPYDGAYAEPMLAPIAISVKILIQPKTVSKDTNFVYQQKKRANMERAYQVSWASAVQIDKGRDEQGRHAAEERVRGGEVAGLLVRDAVAGGNGAKGGRDHAGTDYDCRGCPVLVVVSSKSGLGAKSYV